MNISTWSIFRGRSPYQRKPGPPENAVVSGLRKAIPLVIAADIGIMSIIIVTIVINLYQPNQAKVLDASWFFTDVPTGGVLFTGMIAVLLVASRLASLQSDMSNLTNIKDEAVKNERKSSLLSQAKVCGKQMILAFVFILAYVVLSSIPQYADIDTKQAAGKAIILGLRLGEFAIPLLNIFTFAIVEESLKQLDTISAAIYEASSAMMKVLSGIGERALKGNLTKGDRRTLKRAGKGDVYSAMDTHAEGDYGIIATEQYVSLRLIITGVRDGDPLDAAEWQRWEREGRVGEPDEPQRTRYDRALAVARRIRSSANEGKERCETALKEETDPTKQQELHDKIGEYLDVLKQFDRGAHNQLMVTERMGGRVTAMLGSYRPRKHRTFTTIEMPAIIDAALATSGTPSE